MVGWLGGAVVPLPLKLWRTSGLAAPKPSAEAGALSSLSLMFNV